MTRPAHFVAGWKAIVPLREFAPHVRSRDRDRGGTRTTTRSRWQGWVSVEASWPARRCSSPLRRADRNNAIGCVFCNPDSLSQR